MTSAASAAAVLRRCWPAAACTVPTTNPNIIVVSLTNGPTTSIRASAPTTRRRSAQLIFDNLVELDDHLRVVPRLAERLDHPDPLTYVARLRRGVRFHDGHELTADDVVFTFGHARSGVRVGAKRADTASCSR